MIEIESEIDDDPPPPPTFDLAGFYVMAEQCSTCIFRPGNLMSLGAGRVKDMTEQTDAGDTNVICHKTLDREVGVLCKGSVDRRAGQGVRIAERMGFLRLVPPLEEGDPS